MPPTEPTDPRLRPTTHFDPPPDRYRPGNLPGGDAELLPEDLVDPDEPVRHRRRSVHRPDPADPYRISYAGTTGLVVVLALGVVLLLVLLTALGVW